MESKQLDFECEFKQDDEEPGVFSGHASVFGQTDSVGDIVVRGAFKRSLAVHKESGRMPALLWQHDAREPIGIWEEMKEDRRGLFARGRLFIDDIPKARQAHALLKGGGLSGLSIGFQVVEAEDGKNGLRKLSDLNLWEVSLVTFPALNSARVEDVKEFIIEEIKTKRDLESVLRDAGFSKSQAAFITAGWTPPARRDTEGGHDGLKESLGRLNQAFAA